MVWGLGQGGDEIATSGGDNQACLLYSLHSTLLPTPTHLQMRQVEQRLLLHRPGRLLVGRNQPQPQTLDQRDIRLAERRVKELGGPSQTGQQVAQQHHQC